jgi:hypothetical protein
MIPQGDQPFSKLTHFPLAEGSDNIYCIRNYYVLHFVHRLVLQTENCFHLQVGVERHVSMFRPYQRELHNGTSVETQQQTLRNIK